MAPWPGVEGAGMTHTLAPAAPSLKVWHPGESGVMAATLTGYGFAGYGNYRLWAHNIELIEELLSGAIR